MGCGASSVPAAPAPIPGGAKLSAKAANLAGPDGVAGRGKHKESGVPSSARGGPHSPAATDVALEGERPPLPELSDGDAEKLLLLYRVAPPSRPSGLVPAALYAVKSTYKAHVGNINHPLGTMTVARDLLLCTLNGGRDVAGRASLSTPFSLLAVEAHLRRHWAARWGSESFPDTDDDEAAAELGLEDCRLDLAFHLGALKRCLAEVDCRRLRSN
eukprot:SAG22_NODE_308_length_12662_cov_9.722063_7_plen_215_part_00